MIKRILDKRFSIYLQAKAKLKRNEIYVKIKINHYDILLISLKHLKCILWKMGQISFDLFIKIKGESLSNFTNQSISLLPFTFTFADTEY
jgi:hypothetical protein